MHKQRNIKRTIIYDLGLLSFLKCLKIKKQNREVYYYGISSTILKTLFNAPIIGKRIRSLIPEYVPSKYISEYEGSFFLIENLTVDLTGSFYNNKEISGSKLIRTYKKHYGTDRIDMVAKHFIQEKIRGFLRFYYQVNNSGEDITIVVPDEEVYRYTIGEKPFKAEERLNVVFSGIRSLVILKGFELALTNLSTALLFLIRQKYSLVSSRKKEYRICMRAHIPKSEGLLRNDFLIDGKEITADDVLFFIDSEDSSKQSEYYRKGNYNFTVLNDLKIPASALPGILSDSILLPLRAFISFIMERQWISFYALSAFSRAVLKNKYGLLFYHFQFKMMILFHSGGSEMVIAPILCSRHKSKFAIYNFGTTVSWGKWAPYAFQTADYYFTWGENILTPYSPTCTFGEVVKAGFWGKNEYAKIYSKRHELRNEIIGLNNNSHIVTFYDLPYFHERSTFTANNLFDFYTAALACSEIEDSTVILKMKSRYNIDEAEYPAEIKPRFDRLWKDILAKNNIIIIDTSNYDPLHIIAISDINVTLELSSPSTIALVCGEAGIFYNTVFDFATHALYPKYLGKLIFNNTDSLVNAIRKHLRKEIDLKHMVEDNDLKGYDEYRDNNGLNRLIHTIKEKTD